MCGIGLFGSELAGGSRLSEVPKPIELLNILNHYDWSDRAKRALQAVYNHYKCTLNDTKSRGRWSLQKSNISRYNWFWETFLAQTLAKSLNVLLLSCRCDSSDWGWVCGWGCGNIPPQTLQAADFNTNRSMGLSTWMKLTKLPRRKRSNVSITRDVLSERSNKPFSRLSRESRAHPRGGTQTSATRDDSGGLKISSLSWAEAWWHRRNRTNNVWRSSVLDKT